MEKMNDLKALLQHEINDLCSAEEQIIEALPGMIEKAKNPDLKQALEQHLSVTEAQLSRLEEVKTLLNNGKEEEEKSGFLGLFGGGKHKCKGMEGLIKEGEKVMGEDMSPKVLDAAIVACAQKIEHYEICGYGTAKAYALEMNMRKVADLLNQTLDEEYEADDLLTTLAVGRLNQEAEDGRSTRRNGSKAKSNGTKAKSNGSANGTKKASSGTKSGTKTSADKSRNTSSSKNRKSRTTNSSKKTSNAGSK